jgi:cell division protein FtsQ
MSAQTRSMYLRIAGVVAAFALVVASCVGIYDSPLFTVSRIEVVGAVHLTADEVRTLAALPQGSTLLRFPADAVAANVEKDPWVASASVSRVFPDGMRIRVTERVPVALVDVGRTFWLVDAQGVTIAQRSVTASGSASASASVEPTGSLPVIRDVPGLDPKPGRKTISEVLLNAVAVLGGISRELAAAVTIVSAPTIDGTTLLTNQRVEIVIGQAIDLTTKDTLARRILSEQRGKVVSIDVRSIDRPTWRALPK